jgi:hypothetical protein
LRRQHSGRLLEGPANSGAASTKPSNNVTEMDKIRRIHLQAYAKMRHAGEGWALSRNEAFSFPFKLSLFFSRRIVARTP